ncbi:MAG: hypothetical protein ACLQGT_00010 [Terracidiphilus sp.]
MRKQNLVGWALATALSIVAFPVLAQQDDVPILRPKNQTNKPVGATLLVICDLACNWKLDGSEKSRIEAGNSVKTKVEPGQHVVIAMTEDGVDQTSQLSEVKSSGQVVVSIELKPVRDARLKAEQEEQQKAALEQQEMELREVERQKQLERNEIIRQSEVLYEDNRYAEAIPLLDKLCNSGHMESCEKLGSIYIEGKGITADYSRSLSLFSKACNAGSAEGCNRLGRMYEAGKGVAKDYTTAVTLYTKACDIGSAEGCNDLGTMYLNGRGVNDRDYSTALKLFTKACDSGIGDGCLYLGSMYGYGFGVSEDQSMALTLEIKACDTNSACGCELAGVKYKMGKSIQKDKAKSQQFFSKERSLGGCAYETLLNIYF